MGNKTNPIGMRVQVNRTWDSRWYADSKDYGDLLLEDIKLREFIKEECKQAGVARVIIERPHKKCRVTIHTARPGVIIGKKGADIETLRKKLAAMTDSELHLNIVEVRKPELDATLVGESIAQQLERRVSFRRAMKRAVQNAQRAGALGIDRGDVEAALLGSHGDDAVRDLLGHRVGVDPFGLGTPDDHVDPHVLPPHARRVEQVEGAVAEGVGDGPAGRLGVVSAPDVDPHAHLGHPAGRWCFVAHGGSVDLAPTASQAVASPQCRYVTGARPSPSPAHRSCPSGCSRRCGRRCPTFMRVSWSTSPRKCLFDCHRSPARPAMRWRRSETAIADGKWRRPTP